MVEILYTDISSHVCNNGHISEKFDITRSVRQGCPLSPYLFVICIELLAIAVRNNHDIKGITCKNKEYKISQYADDTQMYLSADPQSLYATVDLLNKFRISSGLKVNMHKSEILRIGTIKNTDYHICKELGIKWTNSSICYLGINFNAELEEILKYNYTEKINKLKTTLNIWRYRNLSLFGRICIIKALAVSQLIYLMSIIPSPSPTQFKQINDLLYGFIWDNKKDKIKRNTLIGPIVNGGAKMIDVQAQNKSMKLAWIKRIMNNCNWIPLIDHFLNIPIKELLKGNLSDKDALTFIKPNIYLFWQEIIVYWCQCNYIDVNNTSNIDYDNLPLWLNSCIKINNKVLYWKEWINNGITHIKHLFRDTGILYSKNDLELKYNLNIKHMDYNSLISAIPRVCKNFFMNYGNSNSDTCLYQIEKIVKQNTKISKYFYSLLISKSFIQPDKAIAKWNNDLQTDDIQSEWESVCTNLFSVKSIPLRSFAYKFLQRIIPTNYFLFQCKLIESPICTFCKEELQTYMHLFWNCPKIQILWLSIVDWVNDCHGREIIELDPDKILLGKYFGNESHIFLICTIVKYYISLCRYGDAIPCFTTCLNKIKEIQNIEKSIAIKNNKLSYFESFWSLTR